jgi:CBS domain-containing protein
VELRHLGHPAAVCLPTNTIEFAMQSMAAAGVDTVVVIDLDWRVVGVLGPDTSQWTAADRFRPVGLVMQPPVSIGLRHSPADALVQMDQWGRDRLPVIDANGEVSFVLYREDLAPLVDLEVEHEAQAFAARDRVLDAEDALHLVSHHRPS